MVSALSANFTKTNTMDETTTPVIPAEENVPETEAPVETPEETPAAE